MRIHDTLTLISLSNSGEGWIWYTNEIGYTFSYHAACIQSHWSILYMAFEQGCLFDFELVRTVDTCYVCGGNGAKPYEMVIE